MGTNRVYQEIIDNVLDIYMNCDTVASSTYKFVLDVEQAIHDPRKNTTSSSHFALTYRYAEIGKNRTQ